MSCGTVPGSKLAHDSVNVFSKLEKLTKRNTSPKQPRSDGRNRPDYCDIVNDLVSGWLSEDLEVMASECQVDPLNLFKDIVTRLVSGTSRLQEADPDYAETVNLLLDWWLEDIGSVARSFDFEPLDVLAEALRVIVEDTALLPLNEEEQPVLQLDSMEGDT